MVKNNLTPEQKEFAQQIGEALDPVSYTHLTLPTTSRV